MAKSYYLQRHGEGRRQVSKADWIWAEGEAGYRLQARDPKEPETSGFYDDKTGEAGTSHDPDIVPQQVHGQLSK